MIIPFALRTRTTTPTRFFGIVPAAMLDGIGERFIERRLQFRTRSPPHNPVPDHFHDLIDDRWYRFHLPRDFLLRPELPSGPLQIHSGARGQPFAPPRFVHILFDAAMTARRQDGTLFNRLSSKDHTPQRSPGFIDHTAGPSPPMHSPHHIQTAHRISGSEIVSHNQGQLHPKIRKSGSLPLGMVRSRPMRFRSLPGSS